MQTSRLTDMHCFSRGICYNRDENNGGGRAMSGRTEALRALCEAAAKAGRIAITGHDRADVDSVISCVLMRRLLAAWGIAAQIVLHEPDRQSRRVMARFGMDVQAWAGVTQAGDSLILVDHHQAAHAGRVIACVDHHPTAYPPDYPYVQLEACGACAVMILRLMREADAPVTQEDERLAVTALYLDTIALRSAKITKEEAAWGEKEAKRLCLDEDWLRREGMGLRDMTLPVQELAMLGRKVYDYGGARVLSTYVQTDAMTREKLDEILDVLRGALKSEGAALWVYLVHDPVRMRSTEYDLLPDGSVKEIPYPYLASRGKDVMPRIEKTMREAVHGDAAQ